MAKMTMKEFESPENQRLIRERLFEYVRKQPISELCLVNRLKIGRDTLRRFWKQDRDVDYRTLCTIESLLEEGE